MSDQTPPLPAPTRDSFFEKYEGEPPWVIHRPQEAVIQLALAGEFEGDVLDVGCGVGDNALFLAERGYAVLGIDMVSRAIDQARASALARQLPVTFQCADALALEKLERTFDTILDSGLFHVFNDADRARYVESLTRVLRPGGVLHILAFSDQEPPGYGPRRITARELSEAFPPPWRRVRLEPSRYQNRLGPQGAQAWLVTLVWQG